MNKNTQFVKGRYEAPECEVCLISVESTILDGSNDINTVETETFDRFDDSINWN